MLAQGANMPQWRVYTVEKKDGDQKDFFHPIGVGWSHKDGKGLRLKLHALPLHGDVFIREALGKEAGEKGYGS